MKAMVGIGVPATRPTVIAGTDGISRCSWATETGLDLRAYHDDEWGRPTTKPRDLLEALVLTYFENGLSWATVFTKRDAFRRAFAGFRPESVAAMAPADVASLLEDSSIIRNRAKIEATVHNARRAIQTPTLAELTWANPPRTHHRLATWSDGRTSSAESDQLSAALKARGYRFAGPTVAHAYLLSVGVINGHFDGCFRAVRRQSFSNG